MARTVREVMSTDCVTATLQDNLYEIALRMKNNDIGFIPVVESNKLVGVVTDRDLVIRGYADKQPGSTTVSEVISNNIKTITPEATVDEAAKLMASSRVRRLPVVEGGKLLGVVAIGDLAVREVSSDKAGEALSRISEKKFTSTSGK